MSQATLAAANNKLGNVSFWIALKLESFLLLKAFVATYCQLLHLREASRFLNSNRLLHYNIFKEIIFILCNFKKAR